MAPVAITLGGVSGTFSAMLGWLLFGLSFWGAVQVYFAVGLSVALVLIVMTLLRPRTTKSVEPRGLQQA